MPLFVRLTLILTAAFVALVLTVAVIKLAIALALLAAVVFATLYIINFARAFIRRRRGLHALSTVRR